MRVEGAILTIDANVILRFILLDHAELSAKATGVFEALAAGEVILECDPVNLAEVVWVLSSHYEIEPRAIAEKLGSLVSSEGFRISDKSRYVNALEMYGSGQCHFGDACACATALEKSDGQLLSFDRKLSRVSGITRSETVSAH